MLSIVAGSDASDVYKRQVIKEPFAVINCDDFYGRDSVQVMGKFLAALPEGSKNDGALTLYQKLKNCHIPLIDISTVRMVL